jgi:hypothetical protein
LIFLLPSGGKSIKFVITKLFTSYIMLKNNLNLGKTHGKPQEDNILNFKAFSQVL